MLYLFTYQRICMYWWLNSRVKLAYLTVTNQAKTITSKHVLKDYRKYNKLYISGNGYYYVLKQIKSIYLI